jgi:hypothetical protein
MPEEGLEQCTESPKKVGYSESGGAESGARGARDGGCNAPDDAELARLIDAWPTLPGAIRAGILAMVKAAREG